MKTLYHPELKRTIEVPDEPDTIAVHKKSGWTEDVPAEGTDALAPQTAESSSGDASPGKKQASSTTPSTGSKEA